MAVVRLKSTRPLVQAAMRRLAPSRPRIALLVCALAVCAIPGTARAATIDTTPGWNGRTEVCPFGVPGTATYGQVVTVPAGDGRLEQFTFHMRAPTTLLFRGHVYAWDGEKATGPSLWESKPRSGSGQGMGPVRFEPGGVELVAGRTYVLFVSSSQDFESGLGTGCLGYRGADVYPGGGFHFLSNGTDESRWTQQPWSDFVGGGVADLAFSAVFSPPNSPPSAGPLDGPAGVDEGSSHTYSVSAADPDGDPVSYAWSVVAGDARVAGPAHDASAGVQFGDGPGSAELRVEISDGRGHTLERTLTVAIENVAPQLGPLELSGVGTACLRGTELRLDFDFQDPAGAADRYAGTIDWGDGSVPEAFDASPVSARHRFSAGLHRITVRVSDEDGGADEAGTDASLPYRMTPVLAPFQEGEVLRRPRGTVVPVSVRISDCSGVSVGRLAPYMEVGGTRGVMRSVGGGRYLGLLHTARLARGTWTVDVHEPRSGSATGVLQLR